MNKSLALLIPGMALITISSMLFTSGSALALSGTWHSTTTGEGYVDSTYPASFHWDVTLTLDPDGTGVWSGTCSRVTDVKSGWEEAYNQVGKSDPNTQCSYTVSGSTVYLTKNGITISLTQNGNRLFGSGEYYDAGSGTVSWTMDVTGGSGGGGGGGGGGGELGLPGLGSPATAAAVGGLSAAAAVAGIAASLLPPARSLRMPLQPPGTTSGNHLVPQDAPRQAGPNEYPDKYPYPRGTKATMTCPFCGMPTLSPFETGWFCTNALCPARRGSVSQGSTVHQYNQMSWGKPK